MPHAIISDTAAAFLNLRRLPASLDIHQVAALLGRHPDHIPLLVKGGFLKPLGNPAANAVKQFATKDVLEKADDPRWLDRVQRYLSAQWANRNGKSRTAPRHHAAFDQEELAA